MRLNHLDLPVPDVAAAAAFFVAGFGFTQLKGDAGFAIVQAGDGFVLALSQQDAPAYPKAFHIGFLQPSDQAVHEAYARLLASGISVSNPPAVSYGALLFYCQAPGGVTVEVSHRPRRPRESGDPY